MKYVFNLLLGFFALIIHAEAHKFAPPTLVTLSRSDIVYMARVTSVKEGDRGLTSKKITFTLTDLLSKGSLVDPPPALILTPFDNGLYEVNSKWILVHSQSGFKDCVGWAMKGDCEWLPISITGEGDMAIAQWLGPIDKVRVYLQQHPYKP